MKIEYTVLIAAILVILGFMTSGLLSTFLLAVGGFFIGWNFASLFLKK
jgi:uncharacterized membrane protein SpoIIM required for sporulation